MNDILIKKNYSPTIAVVILTLNEEINIERCILSANWANEVIVLDSGSIDKTLSIAHKHGIKTYVHIQNRPFKISDQRNYALEECNLSSDWVLFLDADEIITPELQKNLKCTLQTNTEFNAYALTPKYIFWGKWLKKTQGYPNWHDRMVKLREVKFVGGVWEHFDETAKKGFIKIPYVHYANSHGFDIWIDKHQRYSSWNAQIYFNYLKTKDTIELKTNRKLVLRKLAAKFLFFTPPLRFIHMFIIRGGFLEGWKSFLFCSLYFIYESMTYIKVIELKRLEKNKDL